MIFQYSKPGYSPYAARISVISAILRALGRVVCGPGGKNKYQMTEQQTTSRLINSHDLDRSWLRLIYEFEVMLRCGWGVGVCLSPVCDAACALLIDAAGL